MEAQIFRTHLRNLNASFGQPALLREKKISSKKLDFEWNNLFLFPKFGRSGDHTPPPKKKNEDGTQNMGATLILGSFLRDVCGFVCLAFHVFSLFFGWFLSFCYMFLSVFSIFFHFMVFSFQFAMHFAIFHAAFPRFQ